MTSMRIAFVTSTLAAASLFGQSVLANEPSAPLSRASVKAEARAAEKTHQGVPMGDAAQREAPFVSSKTRAERKAETRAAAKARQLTPMGDEPSRQAPFESKISRADRKAETRAAAKAHQLPGAGEAGQDNPKK